jgi:hypothetical protein
MSELVGLRPWKALGSSVVSEQGCHNYRIASFTDFRRNCCGCFSTASFQSRISEAAGQLPPNSQVRAGANMPRLACRRRGRKAAESVGRFCRGVCDLLVNVRLHVNNERVMFANLLLFMGKEDTNQLRLLLARY